MSWDCRPEPQRRTSPELAAHSFDAERSFAAALDDNPNLSLIPQAPLPHNRRLSNSNARNPPAATVVAAPSQKSGPSQPSIQLGR